MVRPDDSRPSPGAMPVERVRGSRPADEAWRADALAGSPHSRWIDELRRPLELQDLDRAAEICGQVTRLALQDQAPALLLLPSAERRRLQALTAYTLTLLDFARQTGLEGERLTALNRWDFELETTLDGPPVGQPVFLLLHSVEQERPWDRDGFDRLHAAARHRCLHRRPRDRKAAEEEALQLATALAWLQLGRCADASVVRFVAALLRLRGLTDLEDDLRRHRARLPISELPDDWSMAGDRGRQQLADQVRAEAERIRPDLARSGLTASLPRSLRPACRYARGTALAQLDAVVRAGPELLLRAPRVGLWRRLRLLARSRFS